MKILKLLLFISLASFYSCYSTTSVPSSTSRFGPPPDMPSKPGSCYAKCLIEDQFEKVTEKYPVYAGEKLTEDVDVETIEIKVSPARSRWEKRKADRNCLSADPEDCMVWCLIEEPAQMKILKVVKDTSQTSNFEWTDVERKILIKEGGNSEWREVVCDADITPGLYRKVQNALIERGYVVGSGQGMDTNVGAIKKALIMFQRDNGLPVGQLDMESLVALDINI